MPGSSAGASADRHRNPTIAGAGERPLGGTVRGMARTMTEDEWRRFVMEGTRTGKLATVRKDGSPSVVPIWFVLDDDGAFVFSVPVRSAKAQAMRRDPRVAARSSTTKARPSPSSSSGAR